MVSEVNLHDIDYRYADAGGAHAVQFPGARSFGWLDTNSTASTNRGSLPYQSVRVDQSDNELRYQSDHLNPLKRYQLNLVFWQPSGGRILDVYVDSVFAGLTVDTWDHQIHQEKVAIPLSEYMSDGSVVVRILRTDFSAGAIVNEIALEEETLASTSACSATITPHFNQVYGSVLITGLPAQAGTVIQALNPSGDTVGCFTVNESGEYGFMRIYGQDTSVNPPIPGMRDGELVIFRVNGASAASTPLFYWHNDRLSHRVDLAAGEIEGQSILLQPGWNLNSLFVEPPYPLIPLVLRSIESRYDMVLGEYGVYSPDLEPPYNTLQELHSGKGYFLHVTSSTSTNLLTEGLREPVDTPLDLHSGWNWIGYLPSASIPITQALQSISGFYTLVHSIDQTYDVSLPQYSTLRQMAPGEGYLIHATQPLSLTYPTGGGLFYDQMGAYNSGSCGSVSPTPTFMVIYGEVEIAGKPASVGTKVEAVTPRGEIAGCYSIQTPGLLGLIHVYGADQLGTPGFLPGESLTFKINSQAVDSATALSWQADLSPKMVELGLEMNKIFLPLPSRKNQ